MVDILLSDDNGFSSWEIGQILKLEHCQNLDSDQKMEVKIYNCKEGTYKKIHIWSLIIEKYGSYTNYERKWKEYLQVGMRTLVTEVIYGSLEDVKKMVYSNPKRLKDKISINNFDGLLMACSLNQCEIAQYLIQQGIKIGKESNFNQDTPMRIAVKYASLDIIFMLLKLGFKFEKEFYRYNQKIQVSPQIYEVVDQFDKLQRVFRVLKYLSNKNINRIIHHQDKNQLILKSVFAKIIQEYI
eukprot:403373441